MDQQFVGLSGTSTTVAAASMWRDIAQQLTASNHVIIMDKATFDLFENSELAWFVAEYAMLTAKNGMFVHDINHDRFYLGTAEDFPANRIVTLPGQYPVLIDEVQLSHLQLNARFAQQPLNATANGVGFNGAYGLVNVNNNTNFANHHAMFSDMAHANAGATAKAVKIPRPANAFIIFRQEQHGPLKRANPAMHNNEISTLVGRMWSGLADHDRARYVNRALDLKAAHKLKYPDYVYRPRRPTEKKRRMTRAKLAANESAAKKLRDRQLAEELAKVPSQIMDNWTGSRPGFILSEIMQVSIHEHNRANPASNANITQSHTSVALTDNGSVYDSENYANLINNGVAPGSYLYRG